MDEPVLARLRDGDEDALAELVDRYTPAMRHIARAYVRDDATADDVVQDAWLAVLRGLARYEGRGTLKGWIFAIVVNRAKTRGVRDGRSVPFSALARDETERNDPSVDPSRFEGAGGEWPGHWAVEPATWGDQPEARLLGREMRAELDAAIATLPDVQRTVVILRDIAGRTVPEVCELLDVTEANARVLLHRGRAKIRRALETYLANPEGAPA